MPDEIENLTLGAARLALFVAGFPLPTSKQDAGIAVNGRTEPIGEVLRYLGELPKPVEVRLEPWGEILSLLCTHVGDERARRIHPKNLLRFLDEVTPERPNDLIICRYGTRSIDVSLGQFREWERSYTLPSSYSVAADLAHSTYARAQGFEKHDRERASAVVVFGNPYVRSMVKEL